MRGYLIDSERQIIEEIDIAPGLEGVRRLLNCRAFTTSRWLRGNMAEGFDAIYVSRDYLADHHGRGVSWFQVDADRTPPSFYPIAGNGVVHGVDADGRLCDVKITLDELRARLTFAQQIIDAATWMKGYPNLTPEQQTSIVLDMLSVMLAELNALVRQIDIPENVSGQRQAQWESLPGLMAVALERLQAMRRRFTAFRCDPCVTLGAFADGALIWVDSAIKVVAPIAAKGRLKRSELRELDKVEFAVGEVFSGFNNIHDILCGEEDVGAAGSKGVEGNPADNQG